MPSSITHELIADGARALLPERMQQAIDRAPDYYFLGAQGPDMFFFYRPLSKKEYNLGKTLHRGKVYPWFSALLDALAPRTGETYDKCLAYALGFCSHLAADAAFHPFVYAYLRENGCKKKVHQIMENDWDVFFVQQKRGGQATRHVYPFSLKKIAREGVLFDYLQQAAYALGRKPLTGGAFKRMEKLYGWYLNHFHRAKGRYLRPFGMGYLYPRKTPDPAFLSGEAFTALSGTESADGLFERAVQGSAERIGAFFRALGGAKLPEELFSVHMLTGERLPAE